LAVLLVTFFGGHGAGIVWISKDQDEVDFFNELANLPDRIVGLLTTTVVEDRLEEALKIHCHDCKIESEKLFDRLFNYEGPLGTFGAQIDAGFAMGLYSEATFRDLHSMRRIRNAFAHKLAIKDFSSSSVRDLATNLRIPELIPISGYGFAEFSAVEHSKDILKWGQATLSISSVPDVKTPRNRFIRAGELLSGLLFILWSVASLDPDRRRWPQF
jgi:hypothetical protein